MEYCIQDTDIMGYIGKRSFQRWGNNLKFTYYTGRLGTTFFRDYASATEFMKKLGTYSHHRLLHIIEVNSDDLPLGRMEIKML